MISFEEAWHITQSVMVYPETERIATAGQTGVLLLGRVLAEDILSDIDMPPFDKSAVDGFACRLADLASPLRVAGTIPAGTVPRFTLGPGQCARIMTGSMIPDGSDTVFMIEDSTINSDGTVTYTGLKTAPNICRKGEDIVKGQRVLEKGTLLKPPHMAVMAAVGATDPLVFRKPGVAVLSTGDELVEPDRIPGPSEIRNSNARQLIAQLASMGIPASYTGIAKDHKADLAKKIASGLADNDVLILTGGVSMGDYDHVPDVIRETGFEILFKSIAVQPGRPTLFGRREKKFIFGLPGNPVSSFVLFELLVRPFLWRMTGHNDMHPLLKLPIGTGFHRRRSERKSIVPVIIRNGEIFPVEYHGSAHINAYTLADAMMILDTGVTSLEKGTLVHVRPL